MSCQLPILPIFTSETRPQPGRRIFSEFCRNVAVLSVFPGRYYNATRLYTALGYLSPDEFEKRRNRQQRKSPRLPA